MGVSALVLHETEREGTMVTISCSWRDIRYVHSLKNNNEPASLVAVRPSAYCRPIQASGANSGTLPIPSLNPLCQSAIIWLFVGTKYEFLVKPLPRCTLRDL